MIAASLLYASSISTAASLLCLPCLLTGKKSGLRLGIYNNKSFTGTLILGFILLTTYMIARPSNPPMG